MRSLTSLSGNVNAKAIDIPPRNPAQVKILRSLKFALFDFLSKKLDKKTVIYLEKRTMKMVIRPSKR